MDVTIRTGWMRGLRGDEFGDDLGAFFGRIQLIFEGRWELEVSWRDTWVEGSG